MSLAVDEDGVSEVERVGALARCGRLDLGLSLRETGEYLGMTHAQLSKIERGKVKKVPKRSLLVKMAKLYGRPLNEFLEAAGLPGLDREPVVATGRELFLNLMLDETFGPPGMRAEDVRHFSAFQRVLILNLFARTWKAAIRHTATGEGPTPEDVLGLLPAVPGFGADGAPAAMAPDWETYLATALRMEDDDG